jgi:hypothetical protein
MAPLKMSAVISPTLKPAVAMHFLTASGDLEYNASTAQSDVTWGQFNFLREILMQKNWRKKVDFD